jgi:aspartokinase-like uncharacterized kinase
MLWVIKVGGSILDQNDRVIRELAKTIIDISRQESLVILTGGGKYADIIRDLDIREGLGSKASHWLAISCMHFNAYRLHSLHPDEFVLTSKVNLNRVSSAQVLLPRDMLKSSSLPMSWEITSDTISAYVAKLIGADLILVKDVDGLVDPHPGGNLVEEISAERLFTFQVKPVDSYLPRFLRDNDMGAWLVNGGYPERLRMVVNKQDPIGTYISPG